MSLESPDPIYAETRFLFSTWKSRVVTEDVAIIVAKRFWWFGIVVHSERFKHLLDRKTRMEGERKIEIGRDGVRDDRRKIKTQLWRLTTFSSKHLPYPHSRMAAGQVSKQGQIQAPSRHTQTIESVF